MTMGEVDRFHVGLVERITRWALVATLALTGAALTTGVRATLGVALGGSIGLLLFGLHRRLFGSFLQPRRKLRGLVGYWALWSVKWPLLGGVLYFSLKSGMVSAGWLCIGVSIIPGVAVALALRALAADCCRAAGAER